MAKRVSRPQGESRSLDGWRGFSDEEVANLHVHAGRKGSISLASLRTRLNEAAFVFNMQRVETVPPASVRAKAFAQIEAISKRLLSALHAPSGKPKDMPRWITAYGGLEDFNRRRALRREASGTALLPLDHTVEGIWQLAIAAGFARQQQSFLTKRKRQTREVDEAADAFLTALVQIWRKDFGRRGVGSKAFYAFASEAFQVVDDSVTDVAVRRRAERWLTKSKSM